MSGRTSPFDLEGLTCVVAGAGGLVGSGCMEALSKSGASTIGIDIKGSESGSNGIHGVDITDESGLTSFFQELPQLAPKGKAWAFVNCAYPRSANWSKLGFENVSLKDWDDNSHLQLGSTFLFTREAVKFLKARNGGAIVNLSSIYGVNGPDMRVYEGTSMVNPAPYSAIKAGVVGLTRYVATTYGKDGIRANVVCLGGIRNGQPESFVKAYEARTPLGRMGSPEDVAGVIAFLVGPSASYISGAVIPVDGGWTAW